MKFKAVVLAMILAAPFSALQADGKDRPELVLYVYDSFVAKHGLGPEIFPAFEAKCGCKIRALPSGDGAQLLTRIQLDSRRGVDVAHVVIGLDQNTWKAAKPFVSPWGTWVPRGLSEIRSEARMESGFLPMDFGHFAWIADSKQLSSRGLPEPQSLQDLLKPEWKRSLILEDPRTSTPGLAFLLYTQSVLGDGAWKFWEVLRGQWLTLATGWEGAYGLFLKGEAPLVWSYATSQAYHEEHGDSPGPKRRYRALLFREGQPIQIEGAALLKKARNSDAELALSREFLEFLISPEVQEKIPSHNWMWPARSGTRVPRSFEHLPEVKKTIAGRISGPKEIQGVLRRWSQAVEGIH